MVKVVPCLEEFPEKGESVAGVVPFPEAGEITVVVDTSVSFPDPVEVFFPSSGVEELGDGDGGGLSPVPLAAESAVGTVAPGEETEPFEAATDGVVWVPLPGCGEEVVPVPGK